MSDERTPILVGTAQLVERNVDPAEATEPLAMLEQMARGAAENAGAGDALLRKLDTVAILNVAGWQARNGPQVVAEKIGAPAKKFYTSEMGGQIGVTAVNLLAERIVAGESQAALLAGCNNLRAVTKAGPAGVDLDWTVGGTSDPEMIGMAKAGSSELEAKYGMVMPPDIYPMFENALRASLGFSLDEHYQRIGKLFHAFSAVAAKNPYAWFPVERSAAELSEPSASNRMICFPYPKYLNAVMATDQSAGVLITSQAMAKKLGIPEENWIYWRGGAVEVEDPWLVSHRPSFCESPALKTCHETAFANAGLGLDEIDLLDFYSCFPSAVAMACEMLDLAQDDSRGLTLTGGLPYAGGPGNSYSFHSLATAVTGLREKNGEHALVTGNGWYLTKHSATILSRQPSPTGHPPSASAATEETRTGWSAPPVQLQAEPNGPARVETYTITYDRDGAPERGIIIGRLAESDERFLANTPTDPDLLATLEKVELIGTEGTVTYEDGQNIFTPN